LPLGGALACDAPVDGMAAVPLSIGLMPAGGAIVWVDAGAVCDDCIAPGIAAVWPAADRPAAAALSAVRLSLASSIVHPPSIMLAAAAANASACQ
jgi:hypothetical protein